MTTRRQAFRNAMLIGAVLVGAELGALALVSRPAPASPAVMDVTCTSPYAPPPAPAPSQPVANVPDALSI